MTWLALKPFALAAWRVLSITIPIPLALIIAAGIWVHFDKSSAIRRAVDRAVTDLVSGAELDALRAQLAAEKTARELFEAKAESLAEANRQFDQSRIAAEMENKVLNDELDEIRAAPGSDDCTVDRYLFDRLRNK